MASQLAISIPQANVQPTEIHPAVSETSRARSAGTTTNIQGSQQGAMGVSRNSSLISAMSRRRESSA